MKRDIEDLSVIKHFMSSYGWVKHKTQGVIDADGVNGLAEYPKLIAKLSSSTVLTPHPKEFSRILGKDISKILENRIAFVTRFASEHSINIVLKGAASIIAQRMSARMAAPWRTPSIVPEFSSEY